MGLQIVSSLVVTLVVCFVLPAMGLGLTWGALTIGAWSPFAAVSDLGKSYFTDFLSTFGAGSVSQGVIIICLTLSIVGGLFEMLTFYKYRYHLR